MAHRDDDGDLVWNEYEMREVIDDTTKSSMDCERSRIAELVQWYAEKGEWAVGVSPRVLLRQMASIIRSGETRRFEYEEWRDKHKEWK